jgi:hypothetical protein
MALASKSGKNDVRDFWRMADIPVASSHARRFIQLLVLGSFWCVFVGITNTNSLQ